MRILFNALSGLAVCALVAGAQPAIDAGIPVTDPLVIAKCGACHASDNQGNMQRISFARTTPENWQDILKRMIVEYNVSVSTPEARSIVKYLSGSHGLAPEEAAPVMYDAERRVSEEDVPTDTLRDTCGKCHAFARGLSWRRSADDWKQFTQAHAARYKVRSADEALAFLVKAAPLRTSEWDAWSGGTHAANLAGTWQVTAHLPGRGSYFGEMQIERSGDDEYNTRVTLTSAIDKSKISKSGHIAIYGGSAWRGRSGGSANAKPGPDDPSNETREVMLISADQSSATGRWYWGQYQEFGFDVKLHRQTSEAYLTLVDRLSLKAGSQRNSVRVSGNNLPSQVRPADLNLGAGVTVRQITSISANAIEAEADVAADAKPGMRNITLLRATLPNAFAVYDRVDYLAVTPASSVAAFADATHPKGYQQFEAIGYQRGPDGKLHTADDLPLGPIEVNWSIQVFHTAEAASSAVVGSISPTGLFTPATDYPHNNFDTWAIATAKDAKGVDGTPLEGKSYMVVTVPTYTFNGRRYVRDLNRWVDDGPAN